MSSSSETMSQPDKVVTFSFLLPTRNRPQQVNTLFQSIVDTTHNLNEIEVILGVDDDDLASQNITHDTLAVKTVVVPKRSTMGKLNRACFDASSGRYVMLINDDVILQTRNWDLLVAEAFARYEDDIALIHVNDLLFQEKLCTFPLLSRKACLEIGICPDYYKRYAIDDHIFDIYNILAYLGHDRMVYLPHVIFEHQNYEHLESGLNTRHDKLFVSANARTYMPSPLIIAEDSARFSRAMDERKRAALKLAFMIDELIDKDQAERLQSVYKQLLRYVITSHPYPEIRELVDRAAHRRFGKFLLYPLVYFKRFDNWACHHQFNGLKGFAVRIYSKGARRIAAGGYRRLKGVTR
jgi:hypothetical protein